MKQIAKFIFRIFIGLTAIIFLLGCSLLTIFAVRVALGLNLERVNLSGTGSMYPTFPKGKGKTTKDQSLEVVASPGMFPYPNGLELFGRRYFNTEISRGDIVVFENARTKAITKKLSGRETGWAKRVIALEGDKLELRGGIVYLNNKPLKETYTAKPRSTFGENFLSECEPVTVPKNHIFVMGDNRKGSGDSREIGFISLKDIDHVLPLSRQKGVYDHFWRSTKNDFSEQAKIRLNKNEYLKLLNEARIKAGVAPLSYQPQLEQTAFLRGQVILRDNDFSFEATKSGSTMEKVMESVGYWNVVYGEAPQLGYYEATELLENQWEFPESKNFLLNKDYDEVGIAEVEGNLNSCPAQVIVMHFAGYLPPDYSVEEIASWQNAVNSLKEVIPSWEKAKGIKQIDQDKLNQLLSLLKEEQQIAENTLTKMKANEWLSKKEEQDADRFANLAKESASLSNELNKR